MKIAAVVILYHPTEDAISNIKTYYDWVDKLFVIDNTETKSLIQDDLSQLPKVSLFHDFENGGIAKRLNAACRLAIGEQFDWLLTMDQDTSFEVSTISAYLECFNEYKGKEEVAMFGTKFSRHDQPISDDCASVRAEKLITSGSLLNVSLYEKIGGFDEQLFIDGVDYDYCFRAQMAGYPVVQFPNIYIRHTVGNEVYRSSIKTLFLLKKKKEIHSALRCYYMYRNMLYLEEKYKGKDKMYSKQIRGYVLSRVKVTLLYGRNTRKILQYLKLAKSDFKNNRMGKITNDRVVP
ncbi:glycosyltransferase [Segetibacter aerophilus]|uniref:Glycosyl transferase n=1 Tax=Segetibacter aerophilus TaxID=670293 RepID=A0A512BF22_9BACT|nr:glycosyltransferase [Segetibacter aerophilus]GEO10495.1 glycosyl transferase [Segetibacter aerophilus]